jgi:hypothetical protein
VDYAFFDDIEFIYSAWLSDLKVNNVTIDGFSKGVLHYGGPTLSGAPPYSFPYQPADFSYTPEVSDVKSVVITNVNGPEGDANGGYTSIVVTAEDGVTQKEYRMYYFVYLSDNNNLLDMKYTLDGTTSIDIFNFNASQTVYNITLEDPEEVRIPEIVETSIVLSDPATAEIQRIEQPTGVNSKGMVVVRAENLKLKSYNIMFSKVQSTNSKLNWIKIGGTDIAGFDPDIIEYNHSITTCVTTLPAITYEKSSAWANVVYSPATLTNRTATIKVIAENNTERIYSLNFTLTNNNAQLLGYRINTTNRNNVFSTTNFTDTYSASLTAPFTLSLSSTAAQQVCQGSTVEFPSTTVWYPDTNKILVTAQDLITKQEYGVIVKNTNSFLKQTTGQNVGLKYLYNGVVRNITVPSSSGQGDATINVTIPVVGPNEPCVLIEADTQAPVVDTIIYTQPENRAGNSGRVKVIANDGVTNKTYIINFTPTISTDATLSYMTYDGIPVPGFSPTNETYTLIFPSTTTEVPLLDFEPSFQWLPEENVVYTEALTLNDTAYIEVTAENGTTKRTYTIIFEVVPQEKDAYLVDIRYQNKTIDNFNPTIYEYTQNIPYSNPLPPAISVVASSPTALPFFAQQMTTPPYTQKVLVYSEDMTVSKTYTIHFNRVKDTVSTLAEIRINYLLLPDFHPEVFEYEYELPYTELENPVVTVIPAFQYAQITMVQPTSVNETVVINVNAEDDNYSAVYTVDITRALSPVNNIETIIYDYDNQTYEVNCTGTVMTIMLPVETEGEPVITDIILVDNRADYEIEEQPDETNNFTATISVTAENEDEETYIVSFQRTLSESTLLTGIGYTLGGTYYPIDFDPEVTTYTFILPFNNSFIPVISATAAWKNTVVTTTDPTSAFGQGSILVISEDGQYNISYTIVFLRKGDAHLVSLSYNLDGVSYPISNFSPTTFNYSINLDIATTSIPVLEYVLEDNRCDVVIVQQEAPNGTSELKIITWNQDDSLTYTVNFTVLLSTEALLDSLFIDGVFMENFDPNVFTYHYPQYEYGTEPIPYPVISGKAKYADATLEDTQISGYPGEAALKVTAGNPSFTNTYTVSFSVEAGDNNYLEELTINGSLYGIFDKYVYFYKPTLLYGSTNVPVINGIPEDERATIEIVQAQEFGDTAKIFVTAINGEVAIYQVLFVVDKNNNAYAKMIYIDWEPLEDFDGFIYEYTCILPANYTGEPFVAAETEDPNASWIRKDVSFIPLIKQIIVTAENGVEQNIYTISFEIKNSIIHFDDETTIQVYPNPASDILYFNVNELRQVGYLEIYSLEGKKTDCHTLQEGLNIINIEHFPKGIYFYKIFSDRTMIGAGKFVKN